MYPDHIIFSVRVFAQKVCILAHLAQVMTETHHRNSWLKTGGREIISSQRERDGRESVFPGSLRKLFEVQARDVIVTQHIACWELRQ